LCVPQWVDPTTGRNLRGGGGVKTMSQLAGDTLKKPRGNDSE